MSSTKGRGKVSHLLHLLPRPWQHWGVLWGSYITTFTVLGSGSSLHLPPPESGYQTILCLRSKLTSKHFFGETLGNITCTNSQTRREGKGKQKSYTSCYLKSWW